MKITESSNMPPIDLVALGKMLGDDPSLVQMILGKFLAEIAGDIAALGELAASGDPELIRALAHRLNGTCSNAQAMPISMSLSCFKPQWLLAICRKLPV